MDAPGGCISVQIGRKGALPGAARAAVRGAVETSKHAQGKPRSCPTFASE
eukprot:CAMPEP_0197891136 /NCGR_PEP_ID=MMETSP1439-20131203/27394_1 /TAXON_ID=66791 /ORGANISM="Gonyaulax spinifera, Strain CCMP409" /LENGTH=49 /DNA_ID=CAMNT_0043511211 /DNA_START=57 /DNA_END=206 /DNA_ORIENTATION=+